MRRPFDVNDSVAGEEREVNIDSEIAFEEAHSARSEGVLERAGDVRSRSRTLIILLFLVFGSIAGRLYYLGVLNHKYYFAVADENRLRIEFLPAPRGAIYDRNGEVLAGNRPSFELVALPLNLPKDVSKQAEVIAGISAMAELSSDEVSELIFRDGARQFQSIAIKQNLDREKALLFFEQEKQLPGFRVLNTPIRDYASPLSYAHLLGFVGKINPEEYQEKSGSGYLFNDTLGKTGIESVYEEFLRGTFGERQVEVDARGSVKKVYGEKEARPGQNLVLNIDAGLQEALYESLAGRLAQSGKKKAAAIAMNPKNGEILAYVSLPGYDINEFAEGISRERYQKLQNDPSQPLFNRGIRGLYPPGSTVKPMVALAALQEGVVAEDTVVDDEGYIVIENVFGGPDAFFYGFNRRALGRVNVRDAIALSSDVFFYTVGGGYEPAEIDGLGIDKIAAYYNQFKIGDVLGIDLDGERAGLVPTPQWKKERFPDDPEQGRWYLGNTYHAAIGQGDVLATPLQVLSWTATIANGGAVYQPYIVNRVEDNDGNVIRQFAPLEVGRVEAEERFFEVVREGMREAVLSGTAKSLSTLPIAVAAKTGTAQFDAKDLDRSHAWFAGYAPFDDPQIAIMVLVEDGGIGANVAGPVAKEGFRYWAEKDAVK